MPSLIKIKDDCQGFILDSIDSPVYINVELLWLKSRDSAVNSFIKRFVSVAIHESLHKAIMQEKITRKKKYNLGEECMVWKMMGDNMSKEIYDYYVSIYSKRTKVLDRESWGFK